MKFSVSGVIKLFTDGGDKAKKVVDGISDKLGQAAGHAKSMNDTLNQTKAGRGRPGVDDTRNYRTQRGISGARGASGRDFAAMARAGNGGEGSFVGAYAALAANVFALTAAFQALSNAARVEQLTKGLELMGARGGAALKITAQNLQQVTDNALSTADAMKAVAQASAAGFGGEEIERLGKVARGASLALGRDMGDSLDRLIKGTIKLEPELLDELGIMTRLDDAVKSYAEANGRAVSSLTQVERRQAFMNAVLAEGERKFGDIADQIEANPYDQLSASIRKTSTELGALVNTFLGPIAKFFADNPFALIIPGLFLASKALQGLGITGKMAGLNIEKAFDAAYKTGDIKTSSKKVSNIFEGVANSIENGKTQIKTVKDLSVALTTAEEKYVKKNGALTRAEKTSLAYNKTMLMTSFAVRNAAVAVRGLGAAIAAATLPMLAITAVVAALTWAFAEAVKAFDKFTGNTKEIKESKARMKELADQAKETSVQVQLMLEAGKGQAGNAFDAIANSAAAASVELEKFAKLRQMTEEANKKPELRTIALTSGEIAQARGIMGQPEAAATMAGNIFRPTVAGRAVATGQDAIDVEIKRLQYRLEAQGVEKNAAKLMAEQYNLQLAELPIAERFKLLQQGTFEILESSNKEAGKFANTFKGLEETSKNINKLSKDLFPKETQNPLRDLSKEFEDFYKVVARSSEVPLNLRDTALRGMATSFQAQKAGLQDNLVVLKNQGIEIEGINKILAQSVVLETYQKDLSDALLEGDKEAEKNAKKNILDAEKELGLTVERNKEAFKRLAVENQILGVKSDVLTKTISILKLEESIASTAGANAKKALEYSNAIRDASILATGAEIAFPEEATYGYQEQIARLELQTATKIAEIKKRTLQAEMQFQLFELSNQKAKLERDSKLFRFLSAGSDPLYKTDKEGKRSLIEFSEFQNKLRGKGITDEARLSAIAAYQLELINQQISGTETLFGLNSDIEDAAVSTASAALQIVQARLKALRDENVIERTRLRETQKFIQYQQKLADIQSANNSELFKGVSLSEQATAYLTVAKIPALENEKSLLTENLAIQDKAIGELKASDPDYKQKLKYLEDGKAIINQEVNLIDKQISGIRELVHSYQEGNLEKRVALDLAQKELQASKDLQASRKALSDSAVNLERSKIEQTARKEGRGLTPIEEDTLRTQKDKAELDSAIQERLFMNTEHDLALRNLELERDLTIALYNAQYAAIKGSLTQTIGAEAAEKELKPFKDLIDTINPIFTESIRMLRETQDNTRQAADNNLRALANSIDGVSVALSTVVGSTTSGITAPTTVVETPAARALRLQEAVYLGFMQAAKGGLLNAIRGGASPLFEAAPENNPEGTGTFTADRTKQIHLQARALGEVNEQAKLLSDLSSTIDDGFTNIFLAAEQGSKAMGEAFTDMAKQILRQIALMTIKMLAFKALEMGLNFLTGTGPGGVGTQVVNFIKGPSGAAGGIIGLANGGIMGRPAGGLQGIVKQPTYLVGEGRYNEAVVPLPNGRSIPVQMHGGGSQSNNVAVTVNMSNNGSQTQTEGQDPAKLGQAIAAAVQRELVAQKAPGGLLNRYSAI